MYKNFLKTILDFLGSLLLIIIFSPIFLLIYLLLLIDLGGDPIFRQKRPGKKERIFTLYKFRTMTNKTDENGLLLQDYKRLTKFGRKIRQLSLDELPQLFNILKFEMSFVGPRPLLIEYLPYYTVNQRLRHSVKPGITGLAQIHGRNGLKFSERFKFDIQYINNVSFLMDVKIVIRTIVNAISAKNDVILNQFIEDVDDLNLGRDLPKNYSRYS